MPTFNFLRRLLVRLGCGDGDGSALAGIRWQLLSALRSLALGAVLIVQTDPATAERRVVVFEGQLLPQTVGAVLLKRGWIEARRPHWMADSTFYGLSPLGADALSAGVKWWKSLPLGRRLVLRLTE